MYDSHLREQRAFLEGLASSAGMGALQQKVTAGEAGSRWAGSAAHVDLEPVEEGSEDEE